MIDGSPIIRDGSADTGGKPCRAGRTQLGVSRRCRSYRLARRCVLDMEVLKSRSMASQRKRLRRPFRVPCSVRLLFNREGDCLAAKLRPGNVHSASVGKNCCCPRLNAHRRWARRYSSGPMRPLPSRSPPDAKPVSPCSAGNHAEQNWIKPCRGKPFDLWNRWN